MRILDRYVLATFIKNYLISLMVLIGLFIVLDLVFNFDELVESQTRAGGSGGASFVAVLYTIWDYYFYQIFLIYSQLAGVIAVAATAFTLARLSRFNELSPILSAGIPLGRIATPVIAAALLLSMIVSANQELIIPSLIPKLTRKHDEIGAQAGASMYDIKAMQDGNGALLFASKYQPPTDQTPATMLEFDLIERDAQHEPTAHISADRAAWDESTKSWRLFNGIRATGLEPSPNVRRSKPQEVNWYRSNVSPEEIKLFHSGDYATLLSTVRINELLQRPQSYGSTNLLRVKHGRVTQFFMNVVLVLLAIACMLTREPGRLKLDGIKLLIVIAIAMAVVFLCHQLAGNPPAGEEWTDRWPAIMAWLPIFLFGPIAILLFDRMNTRKS